MKRREFITLLGGAAAAWPMWHVRLVSALELPCSPFSPQDEGGRIAAFRTGMRRPRIYCGSDFRYRLSLR